MNERSELFVAHAKNLAMLKEIMHELTVRAVDDQANFIKRDVVIKTGDIIALNTLITDLCNGWDEMCSDDK